MYTYIFLHVLLAETVVCSNDNLQVKLIVESLLGSIAQLLQIEVHYMEWITSRHAVSSLLSMPHVAASSVCPLLLSACE